MPNALAPSLQERDLMGDNLPDDFLGALNPATDLGANLEWPYWWARGRGHEGGGGGGGRHAGGVQWDILY